MHALCADIDGLSDAAAEFSRCAMNYRFAAGRFVGPKTEREILGEAGLATLGITYQLGTCTAPTSLTASDAPALYLGPHQRRIHQVALSKEALNRGVADAWRLDGLLSWALGVGATLVLTHPIRSVIGIVVAVGVHIALSRLDLRTIVRRLRV